MLVLAGTGESVGDHHRHGRQEDEEIQADRPVVDVQQVEPAIGVERGVVPRLELPEPGDARLDAVPAQQFLVELGDLVGMAGRGPTRLIVPVRTLKSWGISSMLRAPYDGPTRVTRGSWAALKRGPSVRSLIRLGRRPCRRRGSWCAACRPRRVARSIRS